jgi:hypothetical protein
MILFTKQLACTMTNKAKRNHKRRPDRDKLCFILNQGDEVPKQSSFQVSIFSNLIVLRGGKKLNLKLSNLAFCCMSAVMYYGAKQVLVHHGLQRQCD